MTKKRNIGVYIVLICTLLLFIFWYRMSVDNMEKITEAELMEEISNGNVESVIIRQQEPVPTGVMVVRLKDNTSKTLYVSDVNYSQEMLRDKNVDFEIRDVEKDSAFGKYVFILIMVCIAGFFLLSIIERMSAGNQSTNSKMMNFGKSRAALRYFGKRN